MADLSVPNRVPGPCDKCKGTGVYRWGACVNGRMTHQGQCNACRGTGTQTQTDMARNRAFNRHQVARILSFDN